MKSRAIFAAAGTIALLVLAPSAASAAECSIDTDAADPGNVPSLLDGGGYEFDVAQEVKLSPANDNTFDFAALNNGGGLTTTTPPAPVASSDSWDGWGALFVGPGGDASLANQYFSANDDSCLREDGDRELVFPALPLNGLTVQRKLFVPATGVGGRLLQLLTNRGSKPVTTSVQIGDTKSLADAGDLGSDEDTAVRASSSGDVSLTPADLWAVTSDHADAGPDNADFALAHVLDGPGGRQRVDFAVLAGTEVGVGDNPQDNLAWRWDGVTIQPGQTLALVSFEIQQGVAGRDAATEDAAAASQANAYQAAAPATLFASMTRSEQAAVSNWANPVKCLGRRVTIAGTDLRDKIIGTKRPDVIFAGRGNDKVLGKKGNDRICGGAGKDKLFGGPGKRDLIKGGGGKDVEKP